MVSSHYSETKYRSCGRPSGRGTADDRERAADGGVRACRLSAGDGAAPWDAGLLNQQFWLWGQDIRRGDNILLRYGFQRTRPPGDVQGGRCYTTRIDARRTVVLWGFGIFYGDEALGGLYLSRFRLDPLLGESGTPPVNVWAPANLPAFAPPVDDRDWARARLLLDETLRWISAYETWVVAEMGPEYRRRCLASWSRPVCPAAEGSARWLRLAHRCDATLDRAIAPDR